MIADPAPLTFGTCDCCSKPNRVLIICFPAPGYCETAACYECRGEDPIAYDEPGDIALEIERLRPSAETGEDWALLAALESRVVELIGEQLQ